MSDPWSRPVSEGASQRDDGAIEIELDGPVGPPPAEGLLAVGDTPPAPEPNWRKIVGLSTLGGVVLGGIVAAIILTGGDDENGASTSTTLDPTDESSRITTPPTLPLAEPTTVDTTVPAVDSTVVPSTGREPRLPEYPEAEGETVAAGEYDLDLGYLDQPTTLETDLTFDEGETAERASIAYDPATDRYLLTEESRTVSVVDVVTGTSYRPLQTTSDTEAWQAFDNETLSLDDEIGFEDYLRSLLLGPVRPETTDGRIRVRSGLPLRRLEDGTTVREYVVALPTDEIPEWSVLYGSGGSGSEVEFHVYVGNDGVIRRTEGLTSMFGRPGLARFDFVAGGDVSIELPDPERVIRSGGNADDIDLTDGTEDTAGTDGAAGSRQRYPDAESTSAGLPDLEQALGSFDAMDPTVTDTTVIVGVPTATFRTERGPKGRVSQRSDDFDPLSETSARFDDVETGVGYLRVGSSGVWQSGELGTDIEPIHPRFVDGLLTPRELDAGELLASRTVMTDDGTIAVEYQLSIPAGTIARDAGPVDFVDTAAPLTVYVYAAADPPLRVLELHVPTNRDLPVVWIQSFEYDERDELIPPTTSR